MTESLGVPSSLTTMAILGKTYSLQTTMDLTNSIAIEATAPSQMFQNRPAS